MLVGIRRLRACLGEQPALERHAGTPSDCVIARRQFAGVLVASLTSVNALRKTFELVATQGPAPDDLEPLFAALEADAPGALDAVRDLANMPLQDEPGQVQEHLAAVQTLKRPTLARRASTAMHHAIVSPFEPRGLMAGSEPGVAAPQRARVSTRRRESQRFFTPSPCDSD